MIPTVIVQRAVALKSEALGEQFIGSSGRRGVYRHESYSCPGRVVRLGRKLYVCTERREFGEPPACVPTITFCYTWVR